LEAGGGCLSGCQSGCRPRLGESLLAPGLGLSAAVALDLAARPLYPAGGDLGRLSVYSLDASAPPRPVGAQGTLAGADDDSLSASYMPTNFDFLSSFDTVLPRKVRHAAPSLRHAVPCWACAAVLGLGREPPEAYTLCGKCLRLLLGSTPLTPPTHTPTHPRPHRGRSVRTGMLRAR
jgi:hypothetical protein